MKFFIALLALLPYFSAFADTTSTPLPASAVWTLVRGGTGAVGWNFIDAQACWRAAAADVETRKSSSIYVCRQDLKFTTTYTKPANPFPNGETQTVPCTAPAVGSWAQTRTYTWVGGKWVAGVWNPTTAPAGACVTPPTTTTDTVWMNFAVEGDSNIAYTGLVRYGNGIGWATKTVSGSFSCWSGEFGGDPSPGFEKYCQKQVSAPHVAQITGAIPTINPVFVQGPAKGKAGPRFGGTVGTGDLGNPNQDTGAMREPCRFSHFNWDDPIVYPGQTGKSHLHLFFGNVDVNASTTAANITAATTSTCFGGTLNNTAYWTPALVDIRTGKPWVPEPDSALFYYKGGYLGVKMADIKPFPPGLRMIAGTSSFTTEVAQAGVVRIWCEGGDGTIRNRIPSCNRGEKLSFEVIFPQCWDGVNLDSPDHKSHMAYANNGCPATHPVPLPEISMNLHYVVEESGTDKYLRLSSDNYAGPGGFSMHADWFNGWDPATLKLWVTNCINPSKDCHSALMGNGQYLY